jgi:acyl-CoA dehydrogenase
MMTNLALAVITIAILLTLAYRGHGITAVMFTMALLSLISAVLTWFGPLTWLLTTLFVICLAFAIPSLRQQLFSKPILSLMRRLIPPFSSPEIETIDTGSIWWDAKIFSGQPDWNQLLSGSKPELSDEEQAFIDGPVSELCRMVDKWRINHKLNCLPQSIIKYICDHDFLGIIIPKRYGGLEFSPVAQSEILLRLSNTGSGVNYLVGASNSPGLGELLIKYGSDMQKEYYLPRLARGQEIPCFALTDPMAGSNETSIADTGTVCTGEWQGKEVIGLQLNFCKRYIMLSPIATLVCLAFKLKDPNKLIGDVKEYGITCALVPCDTKGIQIGRRHLPVDDALLNGFIHGKGVFVPLSFIIGGPERAGKDWHTLTDFLSMSRSVTLSATAVATSKRSLLCASIYTCLQQQFDAPLAQLECMQKLLARITGLTYIIDAARLQTMQAIVEGNKLGASLAILTYHTPKMAKQCVIDAMDIHVGKTVVKDPRNSIADMYESMPVTITTENANALTRDLMIFGQSTIRSHPYAMQEMTLAHAKESKEVITKFDTTLVAHICHTISNFARMLVMGLGLSREAAVTDKQYLLPYYQHLNRFSNLFAVIIDVALLNLNAKLKFKEMLSARLGDLLCMLFIGSMVIKQHEECQHADEEWPIAQWALDYILHQYQIAFDQLMDNWPNRIIPFLLKRLAFPIGGRFTTPNNSLEKSVVERITLNNATRNKLTSGLFMEATPSNPLADLNKVLPESFLMQPLVKGVNTALRSADLAKLEHGDLANAALEAGLITEDEAKQLQRFNRHLLAVIHVDDFDEPKLTRTSYHEQDTLQLNTG